MNIKIINPSCNLNTIRDGRGAIFSYVPKKPIMEWTHQFIKAGKIRGNHCHPEFDEYYLLTSGEGVLVWQEDDNSKERFIYLTRGQCTRTPKGVKHVFILQGGAIAFLIDAFSRRKDISYICVQHEQAAAMMADAYSRTGPNFAATMTTSGPGATNAVTGLTDALMDSVPLVCIAGQVPTHLIGTDAFQECDTVGITRPCTKHNWLVKDVNLLAKTVHEAFYVAKTGRPGPVCIDVPLNCFAERTEVEIPEPDLWRKGIRSSGAGDPNSVKKTLEIILSTEKPCILAGNGSMISEAGPELKKLSTLLGIPIATTANGKGIIPEDDSLSLGVIGRNGTYMANESCRSCDVLLAVGAKFDDRQSSSWIPGYSFNIPPAISDPVAMEYPYLPAP